MPALEFLKISKSFGKTQALNSLNFEVRPGEIFGFVGSNGAGKSTTMRIALGVLAADEGEVRWGGTPVTAADRRTFGYMPEERGLYPKMKTGEQLVYLARLHGMSRSAAITAMESWTKRLGIEARRGDDVIKLSLGNQQRVQLAAALVHSPNALILDEPFSGLDPVAVDVMSDVLHERAAAGVPVLFSSHQLDLVERLCDRVGVIRAGHMEAIGSIDELRTNSAPRWQITSAAAPSGWALRVPGISVISESGNRTLFTGTTASSQVALNAALGHGPVEEFAPVKPSLTDLYRHLVSETPSESPKELA